jgi:hypothetical protein
VPLKQGTKQNESDHIAGWPIGKLRNHGLSPQGTKSIAVGNAHGTEQISTRP